MCAKRPTRARAQPLDDVEHAGRQAGFGGERTEQMRGHRRHFRWLCHHAVSRRERGSDLPGEQVEREVPGRDARHRTERLAQRVVERDLVGGMRLAGELGDGVGEEVEVLHRAGDVYRLRGGERLSRIDRFRAGELLQIALDQAREPAQELRSLRGRRRRPGGKRAERCRHRPIDVPAVGAGDARVRLAGRGIDVVQPLPAGGGRMPSVDEVQDVLHPAELYRLRPAGATPARRKPARTRSGGWKPRTGRG